MEEIDAAEAIQRVGSGARLIDVREPNEWTDVHAVGAVLLPMSELQERWTEIAADDEDPALVVCHSGYRSANVTAALERAGVPAINVAGGMTAWESAGGPVVRGDAVSEPRQEA